jgi:hypothetical protein
VGGTITSWNWQFPGGNPSSSNVQNPPIISYPPGTYTASLTVVSQAGCTDTTAYVSFTIGQPPPITANSVAICQNMTDTICASSGFSSYAWSPSGQTTSCIIVSTASASSYTVTGTDANGCTATTVATVNTNAAPSIVATGDQVCAGGIANLNGSGAGAGGSYVWTPTTGLSCINCANPSAGPISSATTYTVIGTDANGCSNTDTALVSIIPNPNITAGPNATICFGRDSAQISAAGAGLGGSYAWTPSSGLSCTACPNPWAFPGFSNTYTVTGTNVDGCQNTATVSITVGAIPFVSAIAPTTICNGDSAQLFANANNGLAPYSYSWNPPNALNNASLQNPTAGPNTNTPYTVIVTDANGCTDDTTTFVYVQTKPSVTWASWTPALTCDGIIFPLKANASSNAQTVWWNLGDGTTLTTAANTTILLPHTYQYGQTYSVTLVVYNLPCSDTLDTTIVVNDLTKYINVRPAKVFTPNGDNMNDCFHPAFCNMSIATPSTPCPQDTLTEKLQECLELEVYDRWGIKMFESSPSVQCWDGKTMGGKDAKEGTYYYIAKFGDLRVPGYVTLLREK